MKMHLNLATRDLDASVALYRTLLRAELTIDAKGVKVGDESLVLVECRRYASKGQTQEQLGDRWRPAAHRPPPISKWCNRLQMGDTMLDFILKTETDRRNAEGELDSLVLTRASNRIPAERDQMMTRIHELNTIIAINAHCPAAYAGTVMVMLDILLKREWSDLGKPNVYAGPLINKRSYGAIVRAGAANFRHSDEWAKHLTKPAKLQMESIPVISDVLREPVEPNGRKHPFAKKSVPTSCACLVRVRSRP